MPDDSDETAGQRTLLVGTARGVYELHHALKVVEPPPDQIGCIVNGPDTVATALPRLGNFDDLPGTLVEHDVDLVLISLPEAMSQMIRRLIHDLDRVGTTWRFVPMLADQLAGRHATLPIVARTGLRTAAGSETGESFPLTVDAASLDPWQLLRRRPRQLDTESIRTVLSGRCVLITGAGGSIGSQLARLVAGFEPARIVLVERSENALFEIDRQMATFGGSITRRAVLHDITDRARTESVVMAERPQVVFHAAAHKHVPMMEDYPAAALENNFFGTRCIADASAAAGVDRFVMISTDKAVNPSSVMGASKRLAELYIQDLNTRATGAFSMVRFGNVLGSACSVLPIWCQQLAHGEPITVTHPARRKAERATRIRLRGHAAHGARRDQHLAHHRARRRAVAADHDHDGPTSRQGIRLRRRRPLAGRLARSDRQRVARRHTGNGVRRGGMMWAVASDERATEPTDVQHH